MKHALVFLQLATLFRCIDNTSRQHLTISCHLCTACPLLIRIPRYCGQSDNSRDIRIRNISNSIIHNTCTRTHILFCLLYKHTNDERFPKISEDSPKVFRRPDTRFQTFSVNLRRLRKISEDNRRFPRKNRCCFDHT